MRTRPSGISEEAWQEAIRAGFHATPEVSRREVEEILVAALPALGMIPAQTRPVGSQTPTAPVAG
jgi:ATP sulfurylase